jgi:hypothetical protein
VAGGFDQRIDFVLARGLDQRGKLRGRIDIVGDTPGDRLEGPVYPIWPSDHAGLAVGFLEPAAALLP